MTEDWGWARLIDWQRAFSGDPEPEIDWVAEPFIEAGTLNALYGDMKIGKSLLAQDAAAAIAGGRSVLGQPPAAPRSVLYLDFENNQDQIVERFRAMGYGWADLRCLHYASYPQLRPLDTPEGGEQACQLACYCQAALVIIDTTSRIINGAENNADTFADLYKHTHMRLKQAGHAQLRIDHEGKDADRGQRGSSAKDADVDVVWHLTSETGGYFRLDPERERTHHVSPFRVQRLADPLRHEIVRTALTAVQAALAERLDQLGAGRDASRRVCGDLLRKNGISVSTDDLAAVVRWRKTVRTTDHGLSSGTEAGQSGQTRADLPGQWSGQSGQPTQDNDPTHSVGLSGPGAGYDWAETFANTFPEKKKRKRG